MGSSKTSHRALRRSGAILSTVRTVFFCLVLLLLRGNHIHQRHTIHAGVCHEELPSSKSDCALKDINHIILSIYFSSAVSKKQPVQRSASAGLQISSAFKDSTVTVDAPTNQNTTMDSSMLASVDCESIPKPEKPPGWKRPEVSCTQF